MARRGSQTGFQTKCASEQAKRATFPACVGKAQQTGGFRPPRRCKKGSPAQGVGRLPAEGRCGAVSSPGSPSQAWRRRKRLFVRASFAASFFPSSVCFASGRSSKRRPRRSLGRGQTRRAEVSAAAPCSLPFTKTCKKCKARGLLVSLPTSFFSLLAPRPRCWAPFLAPASSSRSVRSSSWDPEWVQWGSLVVSAAAHPGPGVRATSARAGLNLHLSAL